MTDEPNIKNDDRLAGGGVQRYELEWDGGAGYDMRKDDNGSYCDYEAVEALQSELAALRQRCESWKALYRFQTAMRYMDNNKDLSRAKAYEMADSDIAHAALAHDAGGKDG